MDVHLWLQKTVKTSQKEHTPLVLVADDDRSTRIILRVILQRAGYEVVEVENGAHCLTAFAQRRPDIVLLDAQMPIMDGFDCCRCLKQMPGGDRVPVMMITGLQTPQDIDQAFEAGVTDFVTKPIHPPLLSRRLRYILKSSQAEIALKESEGRYRSVVENLKEVIFQTDLEGNLSFLNPAWTEVTGFAQEDFIGKPFLEFISSGDREKLWLQFQQIFVGELSECRIESQFLTQSGNIGWMEAYFCTLRSQKRKIMGLSGSFSDITERKNRETLEKELQRYHQQMCLELSQAAEYVRALLPPSLSGDVTINHLFMPSSDLGGDVFDYYWLDSDHLVVYLLDVAGHGVQSALLSISVLNVMRSRALQLDTFYQPAKVLQELNRIFQMGIRGDDYFTMWYGVYSKINQTLTYASAGHPPALLVKPDHTVEQLNIGGIAIGLMPDMVYEQGSCRIKAESRLYVFSDGVYEISQANGRLWEFEAFIDLISVYQQPRINHLESIFAQICQIKGSNVFDDDFSLIQIDLNTPQMPFNQGAEEV